MCGLFTIALEASVNLENVQFMTFEKFTGLSFKMYDDVTWFLSGHFYPGHFWANAYWMVSLIDHSPLTTHLCYTHICTCTCTYMKVP